MHHHSSHLCHTLLKSPYRWLLCALHQESRVNPISNERRLLCISIVHRSEEQTLEPDTLCGIYMSFHFSTSNKLFNKLPLPLYRQVSIHHGHWSCESREWISIQSNHITLPNASSRCWLLFAPQKRESQYIQDGSVHHATQWVFILLWSQWFISLFRDWYVQHKVHYLFSGKCPKGLTESSNLSE